MSYGDVKLGQGRDKARQFLKENPKLLNEMIEKVKAVRGVHAPSAGSNGQAVASDE
jgi:recombination protein RecA